MKTIMKSAAAFFAFFAMTGAAFAEDVSESMHIVDNGAMLQNLYVAMDQNRANMFELVLASAEARMESRIAELTADTSAPALSFTVASN